MAAMGLAYARADGGRHAHACVCACALGGLWRSEGGGGAGHRAIMRPSRRRGISGGGAGSGRAGCLQRISLALDEEKAAAGVATAFQ